MKQIPYFLNQLIAKRDLDREQMLALMHAVMNGEVSPTLIAGVLIALRCKGETVIELAAAAEVMRSLSLKVPLTRTQNLVDTCGTGGDGTHTFNISTAAALTAAAAGARVAKHGGRSVSSTSGSADVLEALGVKVSLSAEQVAQCVDEIGIGFMFAPTHHSAMRHAAPVRRELGVRTIFNLLGPLTNPANAPNQVVGVYAQSLTVKLAQVMQCLGSRHVLVVHGADGIDELSLSGLSHIAELKDGIITESTVTPEQFGLLRNASTEFVVNSVDSSRDLLLAALRNEHRAASDIVALNAGAAIYAAGSADTLTQGVALAQQAIRSGAALRKLDQLIEYTAHV